MPLKDHSQYEIGAFVSKGGKVIGICPSAEKYISADIRAGQYEEQVFIPKNIQRLIDFYKDKTIPKMPVGAEFLMEKFNIPEGKQLGVKLKKIEEEWVKNNFQISDKQVSQIVNN